MKIRVVICVVVLALIAFREKTFANSKAIKEELIKIEQETQLCLDKGIGMINCNYNATEKYNIEIEKILKKLKSVLTQSQYKKLIASQEKWNEFKESNLELYSEIFDSSYIKDVQLFGSEFKKRIFKNQAQELFKLYNEYLFIKKEYKTDLNY